jgi:hypothetical protein
MSNFATAEPPNDTSKKMAKKKKWAIIADVTILGVGGCAALGASEEKASTTPAPEPAAAAPAPKPAPTPEPAPKLTANERVENAINSTDAGGWVGELKLQKIGADTDALDIYLETPEGGMSGASGDDLDVAAGAAFKAAYGDASYSTRKDAAVYFRGGLVDKATGKALPNAETGMYSMTGAQARDIDWDDETAMENIDWSLYRDFVHPAI